MPQRLRELVKSGDLDGFEARCLELLEAGDLPLTELATCFKQIEKTSNKERIATIAQMVLENIDLDAEAAGALAITCAALHAAPKNEDLRKLTIDLYRRIYGETPGFAAILESSGFTTGGVARTALRVMDFCLALREKDTLISRTDDRVVEVIEVDRQRGLFTLRRDDRATTLPAREVVRDYDRIDPNDFRVLRQLRPDRLTDLMHNDPVALVIGLINAYGECINSDQLKHELVPKYISSKDWTKWWTQARAKLKRSPHIVIEGRSPVVLSHSEEGVSLEDELWETVAAHSDPEKWLHALETYVREKKSRKHDLDLTFLYRLRDHVMAYVAEVRNRRPGDALASGLLLQRLDALTGGSDEEAVQLVREILREAAQPAKLITELKHDVFWEGALEALPAAREDDWADCVLALVPLAPAPEFDRIVEKLREGERLEAMQQYIDDAVADVLDYPELVYWLWKGPRKPAGLRLPHDADLFTAILDTVIALDTTLTPPPQVGKNFRNRIKSAFALRDYAKVSEQLRHCSVAAAVTLRRQIDRLDGLGDNARLRMLNVLRDTHPELWVKREIQLAPWEDPDSLWSTAAGIERKTAERDELVNVTMHENAKRIGEAASLGDLSENAEYKFALEERDFLRARLAQINHDLSIARPLSPYDVPKDHIGIGARVTVRSLVGDQILTLTILGPFEADVESGIYNYRAPVSQKIMGRKLGDTVQVGLEGVDADYEVVSIENALQGAPA